MVTIERRQKAPPRTPQWLLRIRIYGDNQRSAAYMACIAHWMGIRVSYFTLDCFDLTNASSGPLCHIALGFEMMHRMGPLPPRARG